MLEVAADAPALLDSLNELYGECAVSGPGSHERIRLRCSITYAGEPSLLSMTFHEGAPARTADAALALLHPPRGEGPYAIREGTVKGWKLVGGAAHAVVAASDSRILVDSQQVPADFLAEYLVSAAFANQPELLAVHAAALELGRAGVLLVGPSRAGKTTISAHLAARGHALLGDEIAVLRMRTGELLPLRRSLNLRAGPRTPELAAILGRLEIGPVASGGKTGPLRPGRLFPNAGARSVALRAVFFLTGFADQPLVTPFRLTLDHTEAVDALAANDVVCVSWGLDPAPRALRLLALKQMLGGLQCWQLKVGPPVETAQLVERTTEEQ